MPPNQEALDFLEALSRYLKWRLKLGEQPKPEFGHEDRFRTYLQSLGGKPGEQRYEELVSNMEILKRTGDPMVPDPGSPGGT